MNCIVISDDETSDPSHPVGDITPFRDEELVNSRPGAISTLANLIEKDENNFPDPFGRVLLNPTHAKNEEDIFVAFHIGKQLKPHQISGIRFMYSNLIGSVTQFNAGLSGSGCILAHSMGLGKTLQVVTFLEALFRCSKLERCLIVAPANTVRLWFCEFNKWLPERPAAQNHSLKIENNTDSLEGVVEIEEEDDRYRKFNLHFIDDESKTFEDKYAIISDWKNGGGVMVMGYEMLLSMYKTAEKRLQATTRKQPLGGYLHLRKNQSSSEDRIRLMGIRKKEYEFITKAIFCPDIVVCDEGHRLKSENTEIVQLMKRIRTKRRLVLTGYPLQNNLLEYWYMVDFVRPGHLGPTVQFKDLFVIPIQRGSASDSVPAEVSLMHDRSHILYSLLKGFVHRRPARLLYQHLPPKYEYILSLKMTKFQVRAYNECITSCPLSVGDIALNRNIFRAFALAMKISNHPDVFYRFVSSRVKAKDEDDDEMWSDEDIIIDDDPKNNTKKRQSVANGSAHGPSSSTNAAGSSSSSANAAGSDVINESNRVEWENWLNIAKRAGYQEDRNPEDGDWGHSMKWALPLLEGYSPNANPVDSPKFRVLLCLIKHVVLAGDRMLIFSQNLATLDLIEKILKSTVKPHSVLPSSIDDTNDDENYWKPNVDYFRFDGSTPGSSRQVLVKRFQGETIHVKSEGGIENLEEKGVVSGRNSQVVLFLISTRAGSLGINLTGANRVCLMDASWNPCQDVQALARVYRFGQVKPCFVYRLVSDCSLERVVYDRQVQKEALSTRVVDDSPVNRRFSRDDIKNVFRAYPEEQAALETPPEDSKIYADSLIAALNAPVVDTVLNSVLKELSFLFARLMAHDTNKISFAIYSDVEPNEEKKLYEKQRAKGQRRLHCIPPQRHDTFREIDPSQRLNETDRRRALLQYEVDKNEYERTVLPTFTKNCRKGVSNKRPRPSRDADGGESTRPAKSRVQTSVALDHPSRMSSERLLSALTANNASCQSTPVQPTQASISRQEQASSILSSALMGDALKSITSVSSSRIAPESSLPGASTSLMQPPIPPIPPLVNKSSALPTSAVPTPAVPTLPLYNLPALPSNSPSPRLQTPSILEQLPHLTVRSIGPRGRPPPVMPLLSESKPRPSPEVIEISDDDD